MRRDPVFAGLKQCVIARTGLTYWNDKDDVLADVLARLLEQRSLRADQLAARLTAESGVGPETEAVTGAVTVGETFFFRYPEQFAALESVVLPDLLRRKRETRTLNLWSAGCSNGAEPYSLSILLGRQFGVALSGWRTDILATDINSLALAEAEKAEYSDWTVRGLQDDIREQCFAKVGDRWRLLPTYRKGVHFAAHNLVAGPPPSPPGGFDMVMCRNVLMYFSVPIRDRVLAEIAGVLDDGGWLLVGHAEAGPQVAALFETITLPACTLYRKPRKSR